MDYCCAKAGEKAALLKFRFLDRNILAAGYARQNRIVPGSYQYAGINS
jgi:hypothetical protein